MEAYSGFAEVYDLFMDNVPYEDWSRYLIGLLEEYGIFEGIVLELGCGTGKMTRLLARAGYDMIGVDSSQEMLRIAVEKGEAEKCLRREEPSFLEKNSGVGKEIPEILYLLQDMREFELYGTVKAAVSVCDSLNYILEEEELLEVFCLVNNYLDPGGVFIFDMNTLYKYQEILGEGTFCENREEASFIWENYFDQQGQINQYDLTIFVQEEDNTLYRKYEETHLQRGYALERVQMLLEKAGLECAASYDAFTHEAVKSDSERMYVVARKRNAGGGQEA